MLRIAHGDGSYPRLMNQLLKTDLHLLDEWGIQKISAAQRSAYSAGHTRLREIKYLRESAANSAGTTSE